MKRTLTRRKFILGSSGLVGLSIFSTWLNGSRARGTDKWIVAGQSGPGGHAVLAVHPLTNRVVSLPVIEGAHQCLLNSHRQKIYAIPRSSQRVAVLSFGPDHQGLDHLNSRPDCYFYGHGALSADGNFLFLAEARRPSGEGFLSVWDTSNRREVDRLSTQGTSPHDCLLADNDQTIWVVNSGSVPGKWLGQSQNGVLFRAVDASSLLAIEISSKKILHRQILEGHKQMFGHMATNGQSVVVIGAPEQLSECGSVLFGQLGSRLRPPKNAEGTSGLRGDCLSVVINPTNGTCAVTHPFADRISLWNVADRELLTDANFPGASGLGLLPEGNFIANQRGKLSARYFSPNDLGTVAGGQNIFCGNGSHLTLAYALLSGQKLPQI